MNASPKCVGLIKEFEGFRAEPYRCPAGIATIGYGSTRYADGKPVTMEDAPITETDAEALVMATLNTEYVAAVNRYVTVPINQNQFDALVDFCYNAGAKNLQTSSLLRYLNGGDFDHAAQEFGKWVHAGDKVLPGLVRRREAEKELFLAQDGAAL